MDCPRCKAPNAGENRFCGTCGAALAATCASCGHENPPGNKFCGGCGAPLALRAAPDRPAGHAHDAGPSAERRQLTLIFCDLVGSTDLSLSLDPEDLREIMAAYQRACSEAVARFGGLVARFMGDGALAYFGYPAAHENDAECAVRAGLEMVEAVGQLGTSGGRTLQARVGIATGLVVVGDLGKGRDSREHEVVGDTPNLAARLQAVADPGTVVVSSSTRQLLRNRFELVDLGTRELKGFGAPVPVWRVVRESDTSSRFEAQHGGFVSAMVGRDAELAQIAELWSKAQAGEGQIVTISAEAGLGKSRLVHATSEQAGGGVGRLVFQCSPFHTNSALHPVIEQLQHAAGFSTGDAPATKLHKIEALAARADASAEAVSLLAYLLSVPGAERHPRADLTAPKQLEWTLAVLVDVVAALGRKQPVLLVAEDLQWVDPTSLALLDLLAEKIATLSVMMVGTFRPEFVPRWGGGHVSALALRRLNPRDTADLLRNVTGGRPLPPEVWEQIVAKTDGIPLFVEELTKAILESGVVRDAGGRYELAVPVPAMAVPATLRDSLMARLDRLSPVKEVAQIGAAIGRTFSYELLAALAPMPVQALCQALRDLADAGLVFAQGTPPRADYTFKHALVQDTAYDSLLRAHRRILHAKLATALREHFPDIAAAQPELVAHHYTLAGDVERALEHWLAAAKRSAERSSLTEAIGHFEKAVEVLQALPASPDRDQRELAIRIALVTPTMSLNGYGCAATEGAIARARVLAEKLGETAQIFPILYGEWVSTFARGKIDASRRLADHFMELAQRQTDTVPPVVAHRMVGATRANLGEFSAGRAMLERCISLYDPERHGSAAFVYGQDSCVSALSFLSWVLLIVGESRAATQAARRAVEHADATKHVHSQAVGLCLAGLIARIMMRDVGGVAEHAPRALALTEQQGLVMWRFSAVIADGWLAAQRGLAEEGIARMRDGLDGLNSIGVGIVRPFFLSLLAEAYGGVGRPEAALEAVAEALARTEENGERIWSADLHRLRGDLLLARGGAAGRDEAQAALMEALAIARSQGARYWELRAATSLARLWRDTGEAARASEELAPVCAVFEADAGLPDVAAARALLRELGPAVATDGPTALAL